MVVPNGTPSSPSWNAVVFFSLVINVIKGFPIISIDNYLYQLYIYNRGTRNPCVTHATLLSPSQCQPSSLAFCPCCAHDERTGLVRGGRWKDDDVSTWKIQQSWKHQQNKCDPFSRLFWLENVLENNWNTHMYIYNYTTFYVYAFQVCYDRSKSCTKQEIQLITTQSSWANTRRPGTYKIYINPNWTFWILLGINESGITFVELCCLDFTSQQTRTNQACYIVLHLPTKRHPNRKIHLQALSIFRYFRLLRLKIRTVDLSRSSTWFQPWKGWSKGLNRNLGI